MLLFYIVNFLKRKFALAITDVFLCTRGAFFGRKNCAQRALPSRLDKSWKNFTRSFCRAEECIAFSARIGSFACGQAFGHLVKFSFCFLVFSCSQILPKITGGMLTAVSRLWYFLFDFVPIELVQLRLDFKTRYISGLHTEIYQRDFMQ